MLVLRGTPGSDRFRVMAAVARAMGRSVVTVEGPTVTGSTSLSLLGPLCTMTHSLPVITFDLGPGEAVELPRLAGYAGPLGILLGMDGGIRG